MAIAAIGEARRRGTAVRLWVVGLGDEERFRRYASDHGVEDLIDFIGRDDEPAQWYRGADLFPRSVYETFSLATVEAAAAGLPVVSTAVGVAHELVFGGDTDDENAAAWLNRETRWLSAASSPRRPGSGERRRMGAIGCVAPKRIRGPRRRRGGEVYEETLTRAGTWTCSPR